MFLQVMVQHLIFNKVANLTHEVSTLISYLPPKDLSPNISSKDSVYKIKAEIQSTTEAILTNNKTIDIILNISFPVHINHLHLMLISTMSIGLSVLNILIFRVNRSERSGMLDVHSVVSKHLKADN